MEHNVKDVAIKIIKTMMDMGVTTNVGMGAMAMALIISAKQDGFTDEQMVDIFKQNIQMINRDMRGGKQ